jgi:hypothetical protein
MTESRDEDTRYLISTRPGEGDPVLGSILADCTGPCGKQVWISPESQAMMAAHPDVIVMCVWCVKPVLDRDADPIFVPITEGQTVEMVDEHARRAKGLW